MCFSIPLKVIKIDKDNAYVEGGKIVKIDKNLKVKKGEYLMVAGPVAVSKLNIREGKKIRKILSELN